MRYVFLRPMVGFVSPELREVRDSPTPGEEVRVAIVTEGDASEIEDEIEDFDGSVQQVLPSGIVVAVIREEALPDFCDRVSGESISLADQMRVLS